MLLLPLKKTRDFFFFYFEHFISLYIYNSMLMDIHNSISMYLHREVILSVMSSWVFIHSVFILIVLSFLFHAEIPHLSTALARSTWVPVSFLFHIPIRLWIFLFFSTRCQSFISYFHIQDLEWAISSKSPGLFVCACVKVVLRNHRLDSRVENMDTVFLKCIMFVDWY